MCIRRMRLLTRFVTALEIIPQKADEMHNCCCHFFQLKRLPSCHCCGYRITVYKLAVGTLFAVRNVTGVCSAGGITRRCGWQKTTACLTVIIIVIILHLKLRIVSFTTYTTQYNTTRKTTPPTPLHLQGGPLSHSAKAT